MTATAKLKIVFRLAFSLLLIVGVLLVLMMFLSVMADARTIYVDDDNWADPQQDGSEEHPYDTINRKKLNYYLKRY